MSSAYTYQCGDCQGIFHASYYPINRCLNNNCSSHFKGKYTMMRLHTIQIPSSKYELDEAITQAEVKVKDLENEIARHKFNIAVYMKLREELESNPIIPGC